MIDQEKALEYKQVAALLSISIDLCLEVCDDPNMTKEDVINQIKYLKDTRDEITTNKETREQMYNANQLLFGACIQ